MEGVREGKLYFPLYKLANVREVFWGKVCQLILSPIVLKPFSFQKEWEGGAGVQGVQGVHAAGSRGSRGQRDTIGRREKIRKWPSSKRRGSRRNRGKLLKTIYWYYYFPYQNLTELTSFIDFIRAAAVIRGRGWRALSRVRCLLE